MEGTIEAVLAGEAAWCVLLGDGVMSGSGAPALLASLPDRSIGVTLTDPPYSEQVHKSVRSAKRNKLPDTGDHKCRTRRVVDLGFEHITVPEMEGLADELERLTKRWVGIFSDVESCHLWRSAFTVFEYIRTSEWRRIGGAPQFTGDRPASGFETITLMHPKGRKRWNGGGKAGSYEYPIVANRFGAHGERVHPTQKPIGLMLGLVADHSDPGELILDPYCGSGTTGSAALRLGRRFIGIERNPEHAETARERLRAEETDSTHRARAAGQTALFDAIGGVR